MAVYLSFDEAPHADREAVDHVVILVSCFVLQVVAVPASFSLFQTHAMIHTWAGCMSKITKKRDTILVQEKPETIDISETTKMPNK